MLKSLQHRLHHDLSHAKPLFAGFICAVLTVCLVAPAALTSAFADDEKLSELQARVEETNATYEAACARVAELEAQIEENKEKLAYIEATIPEYKQKGADAMVALYKMQNDSTALISAILDSKNLSDFLKSLDYVSIIQNNYYTQINMMAIMAEEITATQIQLVKDKDEADAQKQAAADALAEAQAARDVAKQEAEAKAAAEADERAAAIIAAGGDTSELGYESGVSWSSDKESFVASWGARIDAYLSWSPLAGYGRTFAEAAWDYGEDPRYSVAISYVESSCGTYCFRSHNAWGWGSSSWDSWEEAIWAHVAGLAHIYSYTVCVEDAQMYCPGTWESWYSKVVTQINRI